ncbi:small ribosomal subunit protein uS15-like [Humulus lupulus]|uniref:small ribosomal subunit protein uS15-like n=1 Tax=Humulus lupulus TaxID=3486 RepID=UPI002B413596|nr:small ribosomal subunit protein uS15-like [Humulus lupulus]
MKLYTAKCSPQPFPGMPCYASGSSNLVLSIASATSTEPSYNSTMLTDEENICKFAKKGLTPSQINVILHDSHGIAQVKSVTGSKILHVLKAHGLAPKIPEDLYHLIKKAVSIRKHLERNRSIDFG